MIDNGKRNADEGAGEDDGEVMNSHGVDDDIDDVPISFDTADDMDEVRGILDEWEVGTTRQNVEPSTIWKRRPIFVNAYLEMPRTPFPAPLRGRDN